jgi:hypothetical protein
MNLRECRRQEAMMRDQDGEKPALQDEDDSRDAGETLPELDLAPYLDSEDVPTQPDAD